MKHAIKIAALSTLLVGFAACGESAPEASPDASIRSHLLTVSTTGVGSAEVQINNTVCVELPCTVAIEEGTSASVVVRPGLDSRFAGWLSGPCEELECEFTVSGEEEIQFEMLKRGVLLEQDTIDGIVSPVDAVPGLEGKYYIVGQFVRGIPFSEEILPDQQRGYVVQFSADGAPEWSHVFSRTDLFTVSMDRGSVVIGPSGEVYAIGYGLHVNLGVTRIVIKRLSVETGETLWTQTIFQESEDGALEFASAAVDASGNLLVATNCSGDARLANINLTSVDQTAVCMGAISSSGDVLGFEAHGMPGSDVEVRGNLLALDNGGSVALATDSASTMLYEFDATGQRVGVYPTEFPTSLASGVLGEASDGNLLLVATYYAEFVWGDETLPSTDYGVSGRFVGKLSNRGIPMSIARLPGSTAQVRDVIFDDDGGFIVVVGKNSGQQRLDLGTGPLEFGVIDGLSAYTEDGRLRWVNGFILDGDLLTAIPGDDSVAVWGGIGGASPTELGELVPHSHADNSELGSPGHSPFRLLLRD